MKPPTAKTSRLPALVLALPLAVLAVAAAVFAARVPHAFERVMSTEPTVRAAPDGQTLHTWNVAFRIAAIAAVPLLLACAAAAFRYGRSGWRAVLAGCCAGYALAGFYAALVFRTLDVLAAHGAPISGGEAPHGLAALRLKLMECAPAAAAFALAGLTHFLATRRRALAAWGQMPAPLPDADRFAREQIRPPDPTRDSSIAAGVAAHVLVIVLVSMAVGLDFGSDAYKIPGGGGGGGGGGGDGAVGKGTVVVRMMKQPKPPVRRKKHFGRTNSAISLNFPSIDDSTVAADVAEVTENTYAANPADADAGGFAGEGRGGFGHGPGAGGGFGGGAADGVFRFIRLQHDDPGWNDGMGPDSRADMNFLDELRKVSHLKTADHAEAVPVSALRGFRKGQAPPFVYFTGTGPSVNLSTEDVRVLRQYLLGGGMLFADAGSDQWGRAFRSFLARLFPDRELLDISNDDPIFSQPFRFPNGAPPLWHHDGSRARGIKIDGRWAVFYFPGNLNDAWKTGHGGQPPAIVTQAMRLGMNIVYYASVHYLNR